MQDGGSLDHFEFIKDGKKQFFPLCDYCTLIRKDIRNENAEEALKIFW